MCTVSCSVLAWFLALTSTIGIIFSVHLVIFESCILMVLCTYTFRNQKHFLPKFLLFCISFLRVIALIGVKKGTRVATDVPLGNLLHLFMQAKTVALLLAPVSLQWYFCSVLRYISTPVSILGAVLISWRICKLCVIWYHLVL